MSRLPERLWRLAFAFVGLVLVATGIGKALDIPGFVGVIEQYRLVPHDVAVAIAWVLPFVEFVTGLCLLLGVFRRTAAASAVALHVMLVGVVLITLARGISVTNCGCFGVFFARPLGVQTLFEDLFMLAFSVVIFAYGRGVAGRRRVLGDASTSLETRTAPLPPSAGQMSE